MTVELTGYRDFDLVGSGGNAHVYKAKPHDGDEYVAVKVLRGAGDEAVTRRFERERRLMDVLAEIDGVVPILESGITGGGDPYLVMPLYEGGSLQAMLATEPLEWEKAVRYTRTIAHALDEAHERQILHLDVKPANVLLDGDGTPWLGDFGIAEMMGSTASMSASMMTPAYTPPERLRDAKPSETTDVYGLGAMLFALLAGGPPFGSEDKTNPASVMMAVLNDPVPVDRLPAQTPESVAHLLLCCMSKNPDERPQSAGQLAAMLSTTLDGGEISPPSSPLSPPIVDDDETVAVIIGADDLTVARNPSVETPVTAMSMGPPKGAMGGTPWLPQEEPARSKRGVWVLAAAVLLLITGTGVAAALVVGDRGTDGVASAANAINDEDSSSVEAADPESSVVEDNTGADAEVVAEVDGSGEAFLEDNTGPALVDEDSVLSPSSTTKAQGTATRVTTGSQPKAEQPGSSGEPEPDSQPPPDPPKAAFSASGSSVEVGQVVSFTNTSTGTVTAYRWTFDDGSTATGTNASHSYSSAGTYSVELRASGPGGSDIQTVSISVAARQVGVAPPNAAFTMSAASTQTRQAVQFSSSSTGEITSLRWEFGDAGTATGRSASHSYSTPNNYTVRLTVMGPGGSDSATRTLTVRDAPDPVNPPPQPDNEGCQYLGNETDVQWAFSPLPALVDTYVIEFSNGSRQDIGKQPGPFTTTDNALRKIIAVKAGVENALNVGSCEQHGGTKPSAGLPNLPSGVSCRFHDFFTNGAGVYTWSETWTWNNDPSVTSYKVTINLDGSFFDQAAQGRNTHTTVGVNGQSNSGRSVKGIIAVGPGGQNKLTIANCGAMGGTGWQAPG